MCWVFSGTCKEAVINNVKNETLQTARGLCLSQGKKLV